MRASAVVNCHSIVLIELFLSFCQAVTSACMVAISGIRRSIHWPFRTLSSISAMLSELRVSACNEFQVALPNALPPWLRMSRRAKPPLVGVQVVHHQSNLDRLRVALVKPVTATCRLPASGSTSMNISATPTLTPNSYFLWILPLTMHSISAHGRRLVFACFCRASIRSVSSSPSWNSACKS